MDIYKTENTDYENDIMLAIDIKYILSLLRKKERGMICMRFGIGTMGTSTLDDISIVYNISQSRVSQIICNAMYKIRWQFKKRGYYDKY